MLLAKAYGLEVPSSIITYTENLASVASFYSYPMALALIIILTIIKHYLIQF